jgi:hypothetical protein
MGHCVRWLSAVPVFGIENGVAFCLLKSGGKVFEFRAPPAALLREGAAAAGAVFAEHQAKSAATVTPACRLCDRRPVVVVQPPK